MQLMITVSSIDLMLLVQNVIGKERYPETGKIIDYAIHKYSQAYGELVSSFRHLSEDSILQP